MSKKYYIQNTYSSDLQIILKKDGHFQQNVVFGRYIMNRATGQVEQDGYTEVSEELLADLKKNGAFNLLIEKKRLVIHDEAPVTAGSFAQIMEMKAYIKELEAKNKELEAELTALKGGEKPTAEDDGLDKLKLDELKAKAKELGLDAEALKKKDEVIKLIREANAAEGTEGAEA